MKRNTYEIKYQACNLCDALHRNINDNFESVSFEIYDNGDIQVKVILKKRTAAEDEYISDMIAEFSALQVKDCVNKVKIEVGKEKSPLENLVFQIE